MPLLAWRSERGHLHTIPCPPSARLPALRCLACTHGRRPLAGNCVSLSPALPWLQTYMSGGHKGPAAAPGQDRLYTYVWADAAAKLRTLPLPGPGLPRAMVAGGTGGWLEDKVGAYAAHMLYQAGCSGHSTSWLA